MVKGVLLHDRTHTGWLSKTGDDPKPSEPQYIRDEKWPNN